MIALHKMRRAKVCQYSHSRKNEGNRFIKRDKNVTWKKLFQVFHHLKGLGQ